MSPILGMSGGLFISPLWTLLKLPWEVRLMNSEDIATFLLTHLKEVLGSCHLSTPTILNVDK
jgi:hypothetical protein